MFVNFNILNQLGSPAINSNTFANRPAAGQTGRLFVSTDTFEIYRDNGTGWDLIGGPGSSTITGSGTTNTFTIFTGTNSIGDSSYLTQGTNAINIGSANLNLQALPNVAGTGYYFGQMCGSDWWRIYGNMLAMDQAEMVFEVGDNGLPISSNGQRFRFYYSNTGGGSGAKDIFIADYDNSTFNTNLIVASANSLGVRTTTPGAALDVHSTGTIAQFNTTAATGNVFLAIQRSGTGLWRIGDTYNSGSNYFELHNTVLTNNAIQIDAATNKSILTSIETYSTGVARGNLLDYTLSLANGTTFTSPNTVTALGATINLNIAGSATIPAGARSGADFFNGINFTSAGTFTVNQASTIRAFSNVTAGWAFNGSAVGTVTHLAGLRVLFPTNSGTAINVTTNYGLLINDQTANTGTITYTNRWGIYQEGASDLNYMAANLLLGSTTNNGNKLQVTGNSNITGNLGVGIAAPLFKLHVQGSDIGGVFDGTSTTGSGFVSSYNSADGNAIQVRSYGNGTGATIFGNSTNKMNAIWSNGDSIYAIGTISATPLIFGTNNAERARIVNNGNFLIGTTTDAGQKLQVNGNGYFTNGLTSSTTFSFFTHYFYNGGGTNDIFASTTGNGAGSGNFALVNTVSAGNTGILGSISAFFVVGTNGQTTATADRLKVDLSNGNTQIGGYIKTAAPTTGTSGNWKLGSRVAATVVVNTTEYIEVDIGGTLYKLATVT